MQDGRWNEGGGRVLQGSVEFSYTTFHPGPARQVFNANAIEPLWVIVDLPVGRTPALSSRRLLDEYEQTCPRSALHGSTVPPASSSQPLWRLWAIDVDTHVLGHM